MKLIRHIRLWDMYRDMHIRAAIWLNGGLIAAIALVAWIVVTVFGLNPLMPAFIAFVPGILLVLSLGWLFGRQEELNSPACHPYRVLYRLASQCIQASGEYSATVLTSCALAVRPGDGPYLTVERYDLQVAERLLHSSEPPPDQVTLESFRVTPFGIIRLQGRAQVFMASGEVLLGPLRPPALDRFPTAPTEEQYLIADAATVSFTAMVKLSNQLQELLRVLQKQTER